MDKIGIGLIGCGNMGMSLGKSLVNVDAAQLVAVSDVNKELADKASAALGGDVHTDYKDMLARDDVQGVVIASPQFLHCAMTLDAAAAGKHVFSEKPMATNVADCDKMIDACATAGVKLMVGQVCRFHGVHSKVKEIVHSGDLGAATCIKIQRTGGGWGTGHWARDWRFSQEKSGGLLMEISAHEIDFLRFVCGDVASVYAAGGIYRQKEADYCDILLVTLKFKNGAVGMLHASQATAIGSYGGHVDCENGSIDFPAIWGADGGLTYGTFDGPKMRLAADDIKVEVPVQHELRVFVEAIRDDTPVEIPGEVGRAAVEIAEAAYKSVETGLPVELPLS